MALQRSYRSLLLSQHQCQMFPQTIEDNEDNNRISYIKLINVGQKVITRNCTGYLPSQVAFYLQNVHIQPRSIYLSLNAENFDLVEDSGRLGGAESGKLTESGRTYSRDIARYLLAQHKTDTNGCDPKDQNRGLLVLAGGARVHTETLLHLQLLFSCYNTALLNELRGGDLHMLSKEEIKVPHCDTLCVACALLYCAMRCYTVLCVAVLCYALPYCALGCYTVLCVAVLCCALLYCALGCYTVLWGAILCFGVLYCAVRCCTVL
jgi:6-phosphofructo-2-kinase